MAGTTRGATAPLPIASSNLTLQGTSEDISAELLASRWMLAMVMWVERARCLTAQLQASARISPALRERLEASSIEYLSPDFQELESYGLLEVLTAIDDNLRKVQVHATGWGNE
ncbi:MAG: hypothetical protein JSR59_21870 [Proteobacteria bacterium]|nr:hypothetical protein [Pseudomonadota bacterium]